MELSESQLQAFGVALNEATFIGVSVDPSERKVGLTLAALALPAGDGPPSSDSRVQFILEPVGRIAASFRHGRWDDADACVEQFEVDRLAEVVAGFQRLPVYGWEFLDVPDEASFARWSDRLSLDWRSEPGGLSHTLDLFQEGGSRHLDLRIWFDELRIFTPDGDEVAFDEFTAAGVRWWDGLHGRDARTDGHGIAPAAPVWRIRMRRWWRS